MERVIEEIKEQVMKLVSAEREQGEGEILELIDLAINRYSRTHMLSYSTKVECRYRIFNDIKRMDVLQELIDDDTITEIMINGWQDIFYERAGRIYRWDKCFANQKHLDDLVQRIAASANKIVNESVPIADTRLSDGSRINMVMRPIAINGPILTIRKFYDTPLSIERMIDIRSITVEAAEFLKKLVVAGYNIFVSGGTGSGKTTFLNALSNFIPSDERVITIEDSAELKLVNINNLVRLEARNANIEGRNAIEIRDLIKSALRMRPDRIIVGEVRGAETVDMLQAMNTGHQGSLSTGHANGPEEMISRLETMVLMGVDMPIYAIRSQIASAIDIIIHLGRLRDKTRKVLSISEIVGIEEGEVRLNCLYRFEEEGVDENTQIVGRLKRTSKEFLHKDKLEAAGLHL